MLRNTLSRKTSFNSLLLKGRNFTHTGYTKNERLFLIALVFIDGTVLGITRLSGNLAQRVAYNGHKRKHAIKYQAVTTPDSLIQHLYGPLESRRHDWTLYVPSKMDEILPRVLFVQGTRYCIYGDSSYNQRWFIDVPFQG